MPRPLAATLAFTGVALTTASLGVLSAWLRHYAPAGGLLVTIATVAGAAAIAVVALRLLPHGDADWRGLVPGALLIAVGMQAMHLFVVYYLSAKLERASELYGALGASTVVLLWLYLTARLVVSAAFLNATLWSEGRGSRTQNFRDLARRGAELGGDDVGRELEVASEALDRVVASGEHAREPSDLALERCPARAGIERGPAENPLVVVGAPLDPGVAVALRLVGISARCNSAIVHASGRRKTRLPPTNASSGGGVPPSGGCRRRVVSGILPGSFHGRGGRRVRQRAAGGVAAARGGGLAVLPDVTSCHRAARGRRRRPRRPPSASAATSAGERTPPAAITRRPEPADAARRARGRARRASRRGRSRCRGRAPRRPRGSARPRRRARARALGPAGRPDAGRRGRRARRRAARRAPPTHGAGSGNAAVPTTTRSAPAVEQRLRRRRRERIAAGRLHAAPARRRRRRAPHEVRADAARARAVEVDEVDRVARPRRRNVVRARPDRRRARRRRRSRPAGAAPRPSPSTSTAGMTSIGCRRATSSCMPPC